MCIRQTSYKTVFTIYEVTSHQVSCLAVELRKHFWAKLSLFSLDFWPKSVSVSFICADHLGLFLHCLTSVSSCCVLSHLQRTQRELKQHRSRDKEVFELKVAQVWYGYGYPHIYPYIPINPYMDMLSLDNCPLPTLLVSWWAHLMCLTYLCRNSSIFRCDSIS